MKTRGAILFMGLLITSAGFAQSKSVIPAPQSFKNGAWLCSDPSSAAGFDNSVADVYEHQIPLTYSILDHVSRNPVWVCKRVNSDGLKPLGFYGSSIRVSDQKNTGWIGKWSYLWYMNFHAVRPDDTKQGHTQNEAWLCPEGPNAGRFRDEINDIRSRIGMPVTDSVLGQLAKRSECMQANSGDLSMIDFAMGYTKEKPSDYLKAQWEAVKVSDGKNIGWMPESLYLSYMQHHIVYAR